MVGLAGVKAIDTRVGAGVTVRVVEPLTAPSVAWMVVLPTLTAVARPAPLMVATPGLVEVQVAVLVKS